MSYKPPHYNEALPYWLKQSATIPVEPADVARRHSLTANLCRPEEATGLANPVRRNGLDPLDVISNHLDPQHKIYGYRTEQASHESSQDTLRERLMEANNIIIDLTNKVQQSKDHIDKLQENFKLCAIEPAREPAHEPVNESPIEHAIDEPERLGVHHETARIACAILANNTWDGYLTADTPDGLAVSLDDPDRILTADRYYFHHPNHMMVFQEQMGQDNINWINQTCNKLSLARDIHFLADQDHLVFVPRVHRGRGADGIATYSTGRLEAEAVALVCYTLKPDPFYELVHLYHLHSLEPLEDIRAEYIFANFAHAIFRICVFFSNDGRQRKCIQLEQEVGQEPQYKIRDNPERKDSGTLSRSPTKRRGTYNSSPEKRPEQQRGRLRWRGRPG
ncbi:hypothetical protein F5883DRAFT_620462 [Diaporthe sp. PMI_573]|nr:hypothetical protein F5883DRAFT_620462 [Diaporthaceae sp. PMI_573]